MMREQRRQRRRAGWQRLQARLWVPLGHHRQLVNGVKDYAIILVDLQGRIASWNPGAERIKGYSCAEIVGQPFARFFLAEDVAAGKPEQLLREAAASGRVEDEGWRVRKGGQLYFGNSIITACYGRQGQLRGFANVTRDITEQHAVHAATQSLIKGLEDQLKAQLQSLRESEARLQGFIQHASAAIAFKDREGRFLRINPRLETLLGRPALGILGRTQEDLLPAELCARLREQDQRVLNLREDLQVEEEWTHQDGSVHSYIVHKFPLIDPTGQSWGLGLIYTDMTERKQAELVLLQRQKLESLGVLAGGIAHDFNNLLGAMQGNVDLALTEPTVAGVGPYLQTLAGLMAKASEQLRRMLAYSGQSASSKCPLDLNQVVTEMTQLLGAALSKRSVIQLDLEREPLILEADPPQLQQVVMNLVINASEALGEASGLIILRSRAEEVSRSVIDACYAGQVLEPGSYVSLEVTDNGSGMAPEVLQRIFDPFFTTKFTGRGLGLAAIHGMVRSHRGGIWVQSSPGVGSTFKLLFPAAPGQAEPRSSETLLLPPSPGGPGQRGRVLVVDDEDALRSVMVKALNRAGYPTFEAISGGAALAAYQAGRAQIRLILLDFTMPGMDGAEACRELRRLGVTLPIVLCTGFSETEAMSRFQGLVVDGFLQKPFQLGAMVGLVSKLLE